MAINDSTCNPDLLLQRREGARKTVHTTNFFAPLRLCERLTKPPIVQLARRGTTMTELLVAATLLIGAMSFAGPLAVRSGRLSQDARHYQWALDEVSNQLERLSALEEDERETALAELVPSPEAQSMLPNPQLSAETLSDADGLRIVMHLQWDRPGRPEPLTLVAWVKPPDSEEENQ